MKRRILCFGFLAFLLAPAIALSQYQGVNASFAPDSYTPLDGPERWQRWWSEDGGSRSIHLNVAFFSSITQGLNSPPQWGRTTRGLIRRTGSTYAREAISNSIHESMAAAAGTDPRYFACACRGLFRRTGHALEMTLLTYDRNGRKTLDLPQLSAAYGSTMISSYWMPSHYSPLVQGVQSGHLEMALDGGIHIVQEFSPELRRFFHANPGPSLAAAEPKTASPNPGSARPNPSLQIP